MSEKVPHLFLNDLTVPMSLSEMITKSHVCHRCQSTVDRNE